MKSIKWLMVMLLMSFVLSGCETRNNLAPYSYCVLTRAIYISNGDYLTDQTARQILRHNRLQDAICQFSPVGNHGRHGLTQR